MHNGQHASKRPASPRRGRPKRPCRSASWPARAPHFIARPPHADARLARAGTGHDSWTPATGSGPQRYTSPEQEYNAVRNAAGLIDVSTLGKLELRGRDVVTFLEFSIPTVSPNLKVGRTRYGVVCDDAGIILDDGTISRLADDRYFLTTTTGNADAIDSWFRWNWPAAPDWDVPLTNVSGSYAAMNLAGPKSREILEQADDGRCFATGAALPGGRPVRHRRRAGDRVPHRLRGGARLRDPRPGRVWPARLGDGSIEAGQPHGLKPFGVEAQRRLRLDKKHILVSIDTDAPVESARGRPGVDREARQAGLHRQADAWQRWPGARAAEPARRLPHDGRRGPGRGLAHPATTAAWPAASPAAASRPAAGTHVGLAWVPVELGHDGNRINITIDGVPHEAIVQDAPFYDPKGEKLRS